jgi:hypothetical protein
VPTRQPKTPAEFDSYEEYQDALLKAYNDVAYTSHPDFATHPDHLATVATLLGLDVAPVATCRVLELACGDGTNLLPVAAIDADIDAPIDAPPAGGCAGSVVGGHCWYRSGLSQSCNSTCANCPRTLEPSTMSSRMVSTRGYRPTCVPIYCR